MDQSLPPEVTARIEAFVAELLQGGALPRDVQAEIRDDFITHLAMETLAGMRSGRSIDEALERAIQKFGSPRAIQRQLQAIGRRSSRKMRHLSLSSRRVSWRSLLDGLIQDLRYGLYGLLRAPAFSIVAILTLALGVGSNTAVFTIVNQVLLSALPYREPAALVRVWPEKHFSEDMLTQVREQTASFSSISAYRTVQLTLLEDGEAEILPATVVAVDFFSLLGVPPLAGRTFVAEEQWAGGEDVAILSYSLWTRRFGAREEIVGKTIGLGGLGYAERRVIGVLPPVYRPLLGSPEVWIPLAMDPESPAFQSSYGMRAVARLSPGVSLEAAAADVRRLVLDFSGRHPTQFRPARVSPVDVVPLQGELVGDVRRTLLLLLAAVGLVLLIACSNVANLLLARSSVRRREFAMRMALGAGRLRLLRQLLTESSILGFIGGIAGLATASLTLALLSDQLHQYVPRVTDLALDLPVFGYTMAVALLSGLVFGTLPALRATAVDPIDALADGGRGSRRSKRAFGLTDSLVIAEVALSMILLAGAGLLLKSFWRLQQVEPGFSVADTLAMRVELPAGSYDEAEVRRAFFEGVFERLQSHPAVRSIGGINLLPMLGGNMGFPYRVEGRPLPTGTTSLVGNVRIVTPSYFPALGISLLKGRMLGPSDRDGTDPVVLINEAMAGRHWPAESPIGKRFVTTNGDPLFTVVGVVSDVRQHALQLAPAAEFYVPSAQWDWDIRYLVARVRGDPAALKGPMRNAVRSIDSRVPVEEALTLVEVIDSTLGNTRFFTLLFTSFAALALVLGMVGVYGVLSYTMMKRTKELGVRVALGATRWWVLRFAMRKGMLPVGIGLAIGLGLSSMAMRFLEASLFGVERADASVLTASVGALLLVGAVASYIPARRASRVDPVVALRED